jgi:hypothetical protein
MMRATRVAALCVLAAAARAGAQGVDVQDLDNGIYRAAGVMRGTTVREAEARLKE